MSLREEAIDMIGTLTDDGVRATIDFMSSYMARKQEEKSPSLSKKRQAFLRMQQLRKEMGKGARKCAEERFDRRNTYKTLTSAILER